MPKPDLLTTLRALQTPIGPAPKTQTPIVATKPVAPATTLAAAFAKKE